MKDADFDRNGYPRVSKRECYLPKQMAPLEKSEGLISSFLYILQAFAGSGYPYLAVQRW